MVLRNKRSDLTWTERHEMRYLLRGSHEILSGCVLRPVSLRIVYIV